MFRRYTDYPGTGDFYPREDDAVLECQDCGMMFEYDESVVDNDGIVRCPQCDSDNVRKF
jgi:Zn finger protein HypA/HybF involved in hydrogenase expression